MALDTIADRIYPDVDTNKSIRGSSVEFGRKTASIRKFELTTVTVTSTTTLGDDTSVRALDIGGSPTPMIITAGGAVVAADDQCAKFYVDISDMDTAREIIITPILFFTSSETTTDTVVKVHWVSNGAFDPDNVAAGAAEPTCFASNTITYNALTLAGANKVHYVPAATSKGIIAAGTFPPDAPELIVGVEVDAMGSADANELYIQGMRISYFPKGGVE